MIKAVLFDFDGVLTIDQTGSISIIKYISEKCNLHLDLVKSSYYKHNKALLNGEIVHQDMWTAFCDDVGEAIPYYTLTEAFIATQLDAKMINLVKALKGKYLIGMITDNKYDRIDAIMKSNALYPYFNIVAISACLHMSKDSQEIFDYVIGKLHVSAEECVFIDNSEKNLVVSKDMGMKTILFDDKNRNFNVFKDNLNNLLIGAYACP